MARRSQEDRSAATRDSLVSAGRALFGERGFSEVGTEEIVKRAGVTRGALYHHFEDKRALFMAVFEGVEADALAEIAARVAAVQDGPEEALRVAFAGWLDVCEQPDVQRIVVLDAPGVLGWETWREVAERYGLGATTALLQNAIDAGAMAVQPVQALAHVVVGALDAAALYIARAPDPAAARVEMNEVLDRLLAGFRPA